MGQRAASTRWRRASSFSLRNVDLERADGCCFGRVGHDGAPWFADGTKPRRLACAVSRPVDTGPRWPVEHRSSAPSGSCGGPRLQFQRNPSHYRFPCKAIAVAGHLIPPLSARAQPRAEFLGGVAESRLTRRYTKVNRCLTEERQALAVLGALLLVAQRPRAITVAALIVVVLLVLVVPAAQADSQRTLTRRTARCPASSSATCWIAARSWTWCASGSGAAADTCLVRGARSHGHAVAGWPRSQLDTAACT